MCLPAGEPDDRLECVGPSPTASDSSRRVERERGPLVALRAGKRSVVGTGDALARRLAHPVAGGEGIHGCVAGA